MVISLNGAASSTLLSGETWDLDQARGTVREEDEGKWGAPVIRDRLTLLNGKLLIPKSANGNVVEKLLPTLWATVQM